jgi:two-component sensor histidine kinase
VHHNDVYEHCGGVDGATVSIEGGLATQEGVLMLDQISAPLVGLIEPRQADNLLEPLNDEDLVLTEAHHRMKNMLALLAALLRRDFKPAESPDVRKAIDRFEGRIVAFGELYHLLSNRAGPGEISVGDYLEGLCRALAVAILEPIGLRSEVKIEDGFLASKRCERLGLIITELVTNAAKHAFPSRNDGLVRVDALYRDGCWRCTVSDNGIGAAGSFRGSGTLILEDLARSIRGHTITQSGCRGTAVTIVLPN